MFHFVFVELDAADVLVGPNGCAVGFVTPQPHTVERTARAVRVLARPPSPVASRRVAVLARRLVLTRLRTCSYMRASVGAAGFCGVTHPIRRR